ISNDLDTYISSVKADAVAKVEDPSDYESMDKADYFNLRFFNGDAYKPEGKEFLEKMDAYRTEMITILSDTAMAKVAGVEEIKRSIETNFSTAPVTNRDGKQVEWLNYNYEGFPLIASLTKLTQIQADIETTKSEVLQRMLAGQQAAALSFDNYSTLLETSKSAYYSGEIFDGAIVLGRTDESTKPKRAELTLDGRKLVEGTDYTFVGGRVKLNVSAGAPGDH